MMKQFWVVLLFSFTVLAHAGVPKGCPSTRPCTEDKQCKLYAMKHNCQSICTSQEIKNAVGELIKCPSQCLCVPGSQKKLFG